MAKSEQIKWIVMRRNNCIFFFIQGVCVLHIIFGQIERAVKHLGTCGKGTLLRISGDTEDNFSSIT